ncbi:XdhC family aldehyde oxidoreductase maturation factor [Desulfogranum mediterraneum]|uniref:XdhC family aldehyde oxidoreductase maturation factor n=1 Tax=Desulfogranum mediterraneum TaxID=160661 RepID=UPI0003F7A531|nr:XdhC/CoxI family protein [Desulfogranum mediterraneum]
MRYVLDTLIGALEQGEPAVLGAIVRSAGSAPRTSGARMLVLADGSLAGSVGGGSVEGACQAAATKLLADSASHRELDFNLSSSAAADEGMVCGGAVTVLLQRVKPSELERFLELRRLYRAGARPLLLTLLPRADSPPELMMLGSEAPAELPETLREQLLNKGRRSPFTLVHNEREFFVEPLVHPGTVHLAGAGHVAFSTGHLAAYAGFEVVVLDDRAEFANSERYPTAREVRVLENFDHCFPELGTDDYVVIVTRGHIHDRDVLAQALRTGAGYIGMIGSSKKRRAVYASLLADGFTEADLDRVYSPIGLDIGSDTPAEIGVSIVAELIQVRAGKKR